MSVRSAREAAVARAGGADVVDMKEPAAGALGAPPADVVAAIDRAVGPDVPLSLALGEPDDPGAAVAAIRAVRMRPGSAARWVKLATRRPDTVTAAVAALALHPASPRLVLAAFADRTPVPELDAMARLAASAGAAGVLLDTSAKDGRDLFHYLGAEAVAAWVLLARGLGLVTAIAGSLGPDRLDEARHAAPDLIGVRGAACEGGRNGTVSAARVSALRAALVRPGHAHC